MFLPQTACTLGILIPIRRRARETENQNVIPAIAVEVVGEREEIIRVGVLLAETAVKARHRHFRHRPELQLERRGATGRLALIRHVIFVTLLEVRSLEPEWPGHHVHLTVLVEVPEVRALAPELIAELLFLESVKREVICGTGGKGCRHDRCEKGEARFHALGLAGQLPTVKPAGSSLPTSQSFAWLGAGVFHD